MRRCVLHIGMHKTGSSSIQHTLHRARECLKKKHNVGFFGSFSNHSILACCFGHEADNTIAARSTFGPIELERRAACENLRDEFEAYIQNSNAEVEIISGEGLTKIDANGVSELQSVLRRHFDIIEVIVYARDPISGLSSRAQQVLKSGYTFEDIISDTLAGDKKRYFR